MSSGKLATPRINPADSDYHKDGEPETKPKSTRAKKSKHDPDIEQRPKRTRSRAPLAWKARLERAITQRYSDLHFPNPCANQSYRMFLLRRERIDDGDTPQETFELAGTTGNVYRITIKQIPHCTCPDADNGNICKHIIYVLRLILRAPATIEYQAAFLVSELKQIFEDRRTHRKAVDGDCPVCFMELDDHENVIWCKAECGNNIHKECFEKWVESNAGKEIRCVYWSVQSLSSDCHFTHY